MSDPAPDEQAVVAALRAGDEAAFTELVRRHHGSMLRVALLYVSTRDTAAEVVQETWLGVLRGLDRFEGRSSLRTWIFRILTNTAKTRGVRDRRTVPFSALGDEPDTAIDEWFMPADHPEWPGHWAVLPEPWPEDRLLGAEIRERLDRAIDALPASQRAVITLRDVEGLGSAEVCNVLELTETNQRVLLHRARTRVRRELADYLGEEEP
jgi:RNA polymerase sigma-70 factor (ECF subfamily)